MLPSETMIWQPESQIKHSPGKPGRFTQISIMALQKNCKNEAECTTQSRPQPNHLFCTKPGGHVRIRIQSCNHSLMSEQRKPDKRGVISYRWSMFTEIKNHLHTEVVHKCTKSETQQILEAVIMLLIILQHHTRHTKLSRAGTHFGFFIFRNKKNPGNQARIKLRLNVRRLSFAFHVTMASHLILTNRILSHISFAVITA